MISLIVESTESMIVIQKSMRFRVSRFSPILTQFHVKPLSLPLTSIHTNKHNRIVSQTRTCQKCRPYPSPSKPTLTCNPCSQGQEQREPPLPPPPQPPFCEFHEHDDVFHSLEEERGNRQHPPPPRRPPSSCCVSASDEPIPSPTLLFLIATST